MGAGWGMDGGLGWGAGGLSFGSSVTPGAAQQLGKAIAANPSAAVAILKGQKGTASPASANIAGLVLATQMAAIQRDQEIAQILNQLQQQMQQARQSLAQDIQTVESWNEGIREVNDRVLPIVKTVTGQDFGTDREAWLKWWSDQLGYAYQSSPRLRKNPHIPRLPSMR